MNNGSIKAKIGRPSTFTQAVGDRICKDIAEGLSLREVCRADDIPTVTTVMRWLITNSEFREQYRGARDMQADFYFDELIDIADSATPETAIVAKLRIWARQWIIGKLNPRKYADKPSETHVSTTVNNCVVLSKERIAQLQEARRKALEG